MNVKTDRVILSTEWWWVASRITIMLDEDQEHRQQNSLLPIRWESTPWKSGIMIRGYIGNAAEPTLRISIEGDGVSAVILTTEERVVRGFWKPIFEDITRHSHKARELRRNSIGESFIEILNDYYARKERGESPNLRNMAREAGVNIGSLRQAKIRYDQRRREQNVSSD